MPEQEKAFADCMRGRYVLTSNLLWLIGRGEGCLPQLSNTLQHWDVSRYHCLIGKDDDGLWLKDLGSRNGTFLNGRRLNGPLRPLAGTTLPDLPHRLENGDEILLGKRTLFVVRVHGPEVIELVNDSVVHVEHER